MYVRKMEFNFCRPGGDGVQLWMMRLLNSPFISSRSIG